MEQVVEVIPQERQGPRLNIKEETDIKEHDEIDNCRHEGFLHCSYLMYTIKSWE